MTAPSAVVVRSTRTRPSPPAGEMAVGSMTLPPTVASVTTPVCTVSAGWPRAAATNRLVSSANPASPSLPLSPTQVWVWPMTGPSNSAHLARSAGPASSWNSAAPMPPSSARYTQSRRTVPSTVGTTVVE